MTLQITNSPFTVNIMPQNEAEEIAQNVRTILTTRKGSVPLDREFGIDYELLDSPVNILATADITAAIEKYENRARVKKINYDKTNAITGEVKIIVTVEV